jgi:hypothetical protein
VLGVERHRKRLISIRYKISEAIREKDDGDMSVEGVIPHTDMICMGKQSFRLPQTLPIRIRYRDALETVD